MSFDPKLLSSFLRCTRSRAPLVQEGEALISTDPSCRLRYAIVEGIPNMLVEEATELSPAEWGELMRRHGRDAATGAGQSL
jgi:uncharacterized protein YbaR (Trm112 family)